MRTLTTLTAIALLLTTVPLAHAHGVVTVCGEYTSQDGEHYDDAITVTDEGTVVTSDGDATDELFAAGLALAEDASDGDERPTGDGYVDVTAAGTSVGTDNVLWDSDGDGDAVEPNTQGHTDCESFQDDA